MGSSAEGLPSIIVPIHNAPKVLADCLQSIVKTVAVGTEVLLLDDASDDPAILPLIGDFLQTAGPSWRFERQDRNLGFVATVNRGMAMTEGDVVLLNSDTIVSEGWLDGLQRCLDSDRKIATATPWTNNGEIVSIPEFCHSNPVPENVSAVARVIANTAQPEYPELPTAVGFCMAISRDSIQRLGLFNEEHFGLGYGEENDYSQRAIQAGLKNVLCDDVYVAHVGGCSFLPRGLSPNHETMQRLLAMHPNYLESVQAFIASDPLSSRRQTILQALRDAAVALG